MQHRIDIIELRRGRDALTIRRGARDKPDFYAGCINGQECVSSPTREGAIAALLRRLVSQKDHFGVHATIGADW